MTSGQRQASCLEEAGRGDGAIALREPDLPKAPRKTRILCLAALTYGHFVGDGYMGFISVWLALVTAGFVPALSHRAYGLLGMLPALTASFAQPLFGYIADRRPRSWALALGPAICGAVCLMGWARSVHAVAACLLVAGAGSALFHPSSASAATLAGGVRRRGLAMSLFTAGGVAGFALAPWVAPWLWNAYGRYNLWHLMLAGLVATALILLLGRLPAETYWLHEPEPFRSSQSRAQRAARAGVVVVFAIVCLRAATAIALGTFLPKLLLEEGRRQADIGIPNLVLLGSGGLAAIAGGSVSDRLGRRPVTIVTLCLAAPALWAFFQARSGLAAIAPNFASGWLSANVPPLACLAFGGAMLNAALPVNIVQMQELMPRGRSLAASLSMGLAWGVGALANLAVGRIADAPNMGLEKALGLVTVLPLLAGMMAILPIGPPRPSSPKGPC